MIPAIVELRMESQSAGKLEPFVKHGVSWN